MTPVHFKPCPSAAESVDARIDQIARRQSARFLDRLRQAGDATPTVERDYMRSVKFMLDDVKAAIREISKEASHAPLQN